MPKDQIRFIGEDSYSLSSSSLAPELESYPSPISIKGEVVKQGKKRGRKRKEMKPISPPDLHYDSSSSHSPAEQPSPPVEDQVEVPTLHSHQEPSFPRKNTSFSVVIIKKTPPNKVRKSSIGHKSPKKMRRSTNGNGGPSGTSTALPEPTNPPSDTNGPTTPLRQFCCPVPGCRARPFTNYKNPCPPKALELHLRDKGQLGHQPHADAYLVALKARMFRQGKRYAMEATGDIRAKIGEVAWEEMIHSMGLRYLENLDMNLYFEEIQFSGEEDMDYE